MAKFKDYKKTASQFGVGGDTEWLTLEEGDNWVRLMSEFVAYGQHFNNSTKKGSICIGKDNGCPACLANDETMAEAKSAGLKTDIQEPLSVKYLGWVIDRKDKKIKLLRIGHVVFKSIGKIQEQPDTAFDTVPNFDININAENAGTKEVKYTVLASRKDTELTEEEIKKTENLTNPEDILEKMKAKIPHRLPNDIKEIGRQKNDDIPVINEDDEIDASKIDY